MIFQNAINITKNFIRGFSRKRKQYSRFTEERWEENFSLSGESRFENETSEKYSSEIIPGEGLLFKICSKNLFAWCQTPDANYSDFDAECSFELKADSDAYCSGGMIFRMGNDYNYYYFLVSSKGYFRVDCVFNGKPMRLIEWTQIAASLGNVVTLRVTAWDSYFVFYIDNVQVARLNDETIGNGGVTFCAQNYDASPAAELLLKKISVNSIPYEVEKVYSEKNEIPPSQKFTLAKTFFTNGQFLAAAVQMKSYLDNVGPDEKTDELLGFYGEILLNLEMYKDALKYFDEALEKNPTERNYLLEKANILYQLGTYEELKVFLSGAENMLADNTVYWNLRGHSMFYLGNNEAAAEFYKKATELDKENPFYFVNLAKAYEAFGDNERSALSYAEGSVLFFRQSNYSEAEDAASIALGKGAGSREADVKAKGVIAKILFSEGKYPKAEEEFKNLIEAAPDLCGSEIFFLYALINLGKGKTEDAVQLIEAACEKEEYYLYWYKLAEIFYSTGKDPEPALSKAYSLAPDDIWVNNLLGEIALQKEETNAAEEYFKKSFSLGKENSEVIPAVNYSEALIINNKTEQALHVLEEFPNDEEREILLQKGKIYELLGKELASEKVYKKAFTLYPKDKDVIRALASFYYNSEQYGKAEEILSKFDGFESDSSFLNLAANIARVVGNFKVAFDAYEKSLALAYDPVVALNYIEGLSEVLKYKEAKIKLEQYFNPSGYASLPGMDLGNENEFAYKPSGYASLPGMGLENENEFAHKPSGYASLPEKLQKRLERLRARIESETETKLACAACAKVWKVPNDVADSSKKLTLIGSPDPSSPAGKCPLCGKIYCVKCAEEWVKEGKFMCPECDESLKLSDKYLRHLAFDSAFNKEDK